jgi:probable F420-dependent oxidoreductase
MPDVSSGASLLRSGWRLRSLGLEAQRLPSVAVERLGFTFASVMGLGPALAIDTARRAEELGYRSFWTAETTGPEAFSVLAAAGGAAPSLDLGTGVLALQLRTPMVVAMAGATLQALQPEREVLLGVGISSPVVTQRWHGVPYGDRPLDRVREYVHLVKLCLSGERVDFAGDFWTVKGFRLGVRLGERRPKVVVGALNPRMLALAGEVADGVLLNYLPASHVPWSVEQVRKGGNATIYAYVHAGLCEREHGIEAAKRDLFSYAVVDAYAANFERAGYGDAVAEVRERHASGDRDGAIAAVSDDMVDGIDVMGDASTVQATMRAYVDAGVDVPILMPLPWGPDRRQVIEDTMVAAAGA